MYEDIKEYLNWYDTRKDMVFAKDAPIIGLVLQRSHLVTGDEGHYSGVVSEMEARGAKVGQRKHICTSARCRTHKMLFALQAVSACTELPGLSPPVPVHNERVQMQSDTPCWSCCLVWYLHAGPARPAKPCREALGAESA